MRPPTIRKRASEARIFEVNLGPRMRDNETILDLPTITANAAITIDNITHTAAVVRFRASGGEAGRSYKLTFQFDVASVPPQSLEAIVNLYITP